MKPILVDGLGRSSSVLDEVQGFDGGGIVNFSRAAFRLDNVSAERAFEAGSLNDGANVEVKEKPDIEERFSGDSDEGLVMTNGLCTRCASSLAGLRTFCCCIVGRVGESSGGQVVALGINFASVF